MSTDRPMAAKVSLDMGTNSMTRTSTSSTPSSSDDAWGVLSYVLAGMLFYGGIGWLLASHYLIVKRYGTVPEQNNDREGQ